MMLCFLDVMCIYFLCINFLHDVMFSGCYMYIFSLHKFSSWNCIFFIMIMCTFGNGQTCNYLINTYICRSTGSINEWSKIDIFCNTFMHSEEKLSNIL